MKQKNMKIIAVLIFYPSFVFRSFISLCECIVASSKLKLNESISKSYTFLHILCKSQREKTMKLLEEKHNCMCNAWICVNVLVRNTINIQFTVHMVQHINSYESSFYLPGKL